MSGLECFDDDASTKLDTIQENFFGCYLLVSQNARYRGKTYIGFTVDPNRRIRQHNGGRCKGGAKYTSGRGPWDMVLIVHGFPNEICALRFEWAWQNPELSRRLSQRGVCHRPKETPFDYRFRILSLMLRTGPWNRLGLTIRWINQNYVRQFDTSLAPPFHMPIAFGPLIPEKSSSTQPTTSLSFSRCGLCSKSVTLTGSPFEDIPLVCPNSCSSGQWHLTCLARHMLRQEYRHSSTNHSDRYLVPLTGTCPGCLNENLFWPHLINQWRKEAQIR
ncbi:Structure-specific endonuclease subunit SLX1 [Fasciola gigantica]|uniref:Structure-specific endonuclease subunit SLX1 homolog n=1 Tax=Fasciola gigantica TaxID=46835 RepID=A0A504Z3W4_FASGI|nr:Structure-specific endonuclease subunit SLX1 [Fasciola gigantica]